VRQVYERRSEVVATARELFDWHGRRGAFQRLTPPWQAVEVLREDPGLEAGKRIELRLQTPLGRRLWRARHSSCSDGEGFVDVQEKGPFSFWEHRHSFADTLEYRSELTDRIEYRIPFGVFGRMLAASFVERQLERTFAYRHWITSQDMDLLRALPNFRPLRILLAGGRGFLGQALGALLSAQGHAVAYLSRSRLDEADVYWNPQKGEIELARIEGFDAVVNLAGESLVSGRWNNERKRRFWESRIDATRFLVDAFLRLKSPPAVFLSGSAIGYYGDGSETALGETSPRGEGYLAELCGAWEAAALRAESLGARVCLLRTGVVLDPRGGALAQMLSAFRLGAGGALGDGRQWFPWIALEDWIRSVSWLLFAEKVSGAVNLAAPNPVRQRDFARALGRAVKRPAFVPAPRAALRLAFGEMADEALLASARVEPGVLLESGYRFALSQVDLALARMLGRA